MNFDTYFENSKNDSLFIANFNQFNLKNTVSILVFVNSFCLLSFYLSSVLFSSTFTDFFVGLVIFVSGTFIFSLYLNVLLGKIIESETSRNFRQGFYDLIAKYKDDALFFFVLNSIFVFIYCFFTKTQHVGLLQNNFFEVLKNEINSFSLSLCFLLCAQLLFSYLHCNEQKDCKVAMFKSIRLKPMGF